jgi:hypothetical protein
MPRDVDGTGVAASGEHDQATPPHVHGERLVVEDQRIGLPAPIPVRFVEGQTLLEVGGAVDLAGDEDAAIQQD